MAMARALIGVVEDLGARRCLGEFVADLAQQPPTPHGVAALN